MSCDDVAKALAALSSSEETLNGARVQPHCLYPTFDHVYVYVVKLGDGFRVHDGGKAFTCAWTHGREEGAIGRALEDECRRFRLGRAEDNAIVANVDKSEWLLNAILTVANASAAAAAAAVAKVAIATEEALASRIDGVLTKRFGPKAVGREHVIQGKSGGMRRFDFVVRAPLDVEILINAVSPHHNSVASKYVAFADTEITMSRKLAVFDRPLDSDDASLLTQVAIALPLIALERGAERAMLN